MMSVKKNILFVFKIQPLFFITLFLFIQPQNIYSTAFSINWISTTPADNRELQTTSYTYIAQNANSGSGEAQIDSGAIGLLSFSGCCIDPSGITGATINGIPVTLSNIFDFIFPVTIKEDSMLTVVVNGVSNGDEGTYTGITLGVIFNASNGFSTFLNSSITIVPFLPRYPVPSQGSNLVPNPGFENYTNCPVSLSGVALAVPWYMPTENGSSDLFNECGTPPGCNMDIPRNGFGQQIAHTGTGYVGLYIGDVGGSTGGYREYVQTKLLCPMIPGQTYDVKMYVSSADYSTKQGDGLGILLSTVKDTAPGIGPVIPATPQVSNPSGNILTNDTSWTLIGATIIADSAYKYITVGNFKNDANTTIVPVTRPGAYLTSSYYYVDDVSVTPANSVIVQDTMVCNGLKLVLSASPGASYLWSTGATTSSINDSLMTSATYTVITLNGTCGDTLKKIITINRTPISTTVSPNTIICDGSVATISASGGAQYIWNTDEASSSINVSPATNTSYSVTVIDMNGCVGLNQVLVQVNSSPTALFTPNPTSGPPPLTVNFANASINATSYEWLFGDGSVPSTEVSPDYVYKESGEYTVMLIAKNDSGCIDTMIYTFIKVDDESQLWIPNAFTPNGDGKNDFFDIPSTVIIQFEGHVFDRWGKLLYSWFDITKGWDGTYQNTVVEEGVYVYLIKAKGLDGVKYNKTGHLTLIR